MASEGAPPPRGETIREALKQSLRAGPQTLRELSAEVGVSEREIPEHLEHLGHSLRRENRRLWIESPACRGCGFEFRGRDRFTRPGKCPRCRATRVAPPRVYIE